MESPAALDMLLRGVLRERFNSANSGGGWCVKTHARTSRGECSEQRNRILYKQCAKIAIFDTITIVEKWLHRSHPKNECIENVDLNDKTHLQK